MQEVKISGVVITKNEQRNIERCLTSLNKVADEIIVVDSFSDDNTQELCEKFDNLRFYQKAFIDYSEQKNYAASLANNQFILSLDADEELSPELINSVLEIKSNISQEAYILNRKTNYCGKWIRHCGWYPDSKIRLWNKNIGKWEGEIHEKIVLNTNKIGYLKGDIFHYSYYTIWDHIAQINKFTELLAKANYNDGRRTNIFKIIFSPMWKFFRDYLWKLGILDGYYGFVISYLSAVATFVKLLKIKELQKQQG